MAIIVFTSFIAISIILAFRSKKGHGTQSVHDFFVASGQFNAFLVFFLSAGEIYSIGTMVGFPGGIYAKGPTYGIWFLGYILLAYPVGYFLGPKIWETGKRLNAITLPDLFKGHFNSRSLEVIVAATAILFLLPWGQLQFTGLIVALQGLGLGTKPVYLVGAASILSFIYVSISGVRSSAFIAILKDILMVIAIVAVGSAVAIEVGVEPLFQAASMKVSNSMSTSDLIFTMSTIVFQSLGFYVLPFNVQNLFTAQTAGTIRRAQIFMPLYMLMFPFLVIAAYYAISQNIHLASPNDAFFLAATHLLPGWLVGLVAAGASLSGLIVLAGICLSIGPMVTRNLVPRLNETKQKAGAKCVIVLYLLLSMFMTLATPNLMLTLINTAYNGITQFLPGLLVVVFGLRTRPAAIAAGILVGQSGAIVLYLLHLNLAGLNVGLLSLFINIAIVVVFQKLRKRSIMVPSV